MFTFESQIQPTIPTIKTFQHVVSIHLQRTSHGFNKHRISIPQTC